MHSVLAIAKVTLKDALRKRVLFTILFFAVLLTVISGFLPAVRPDDRIRQVTKICLSGIGFFGMVVAIFLSAPSLPDDISRKTIFTVMTKPARRWQILAGKIVGLGMVLALILAVMGTITYVYVGVVARHTEADESGLPWRQANRIIFADSISYQGLDLAVSPPMTESQRAIASGFDRITFHFSGLDRERFKGDTIFARLELHSHMWSYDPVTNEGTAALWATNPATGETRTLVVGAETLRPRFLGFPKALIDKDGRLELTVVKHLPSGSYSAMARSVAVLSQPGSYAANFARGMLLMFLQYMVLVFVAVAASTVLTSTVSIIFALFVYFTGSLTEVLRNQAMSLGAGTNIFTMAEHSHGGGNEVMTPAVFAVNLMLRYFYLGISVVFPNLSAYSPSDMLAQNEAIPGAMLWGGIWYAAGYAAVAFIAAALIFRRKEVA